MMKDKKILIVSNDSILTELLEKSLRTNGYQLKITKDSGEALKGIVDKINPNLIILDIMMPQMEGLEVCLRIRQWSQTPIIMLSTWGADKGKIRGIDLGAIGYLTETFGVDELMIKVEEVLFHNSLQEEPYKPLPILNNVGGLN